MLTVLSAFLQPIAVYAAKSEPAAYEAEYPALEKVQTRLNEDEIVTAEAHTVEIGSNFDVEHDFSGMKFSADTVKITFHEAKNESGQKFDSNRADTYKAVYFVEPISKNPSYHISRNIIVKEKVPAEEDGESSSTGAASIPKESMTEAEMEAVIKGMEEAEEIRQDAEMIAEEEGLLLFAETTQMARAAASNSATMVKGRDI